MTETTMQTISQDGQTSQSDGFQNQMQFLQYLWEGVSYGIFVLDVLDEGKEFRYAAFNPAVARNSPLPVDRLLGKTVSEALPAEMAKLYCDRYSDCVTSQQSISFEEYFIHNGQETWWLLTVNPLRDRSDRIEQLLVTTFDISDRVRKEAKYKEAEADRKQQEDALRFIVEGTVSKTGDEFFRACVKHLAEICQTKYAFVTELVDETYSRSRMLALWTGEGFAEPYEFDLAGTPCSVVFQENYGIFPSDIQAKFPDADGMATLGAESYLGVAIIDSQGNAIGNLGIIDTKPLADKLNTPKSILQLFAARVGAEMERKADEVALSAYADRQILLNQLANQIRNSLDLDAVIATTIQSIQNLLDIDQCAFAWYSPDNESPTWELIQEAKLEDIPSGLGCYPSTIVGALEQLVFNQEILRIDNVKHYDEPIHRAFLNTIKCQSEILLPIHTHSNRVGIIICAHYRQVRPWTEYEVELLKATGDQLAIAIDHAELYAESRTQSVELQETLQELQRTQTQMVQNEKMSSLGQMVAGIAHEINNPVNFIHGNVTHAGDYTNELLDLIALYQAEYRQPSEAIAAKIATIDLDFLRTDLRKLLTSMKVGTERIREIVKSLRLFSRLDEAEVKSIDIHDGLNSTLMILQSRLKAKPTSIESTENLHSEIQVIKDYGNLPEVECYAGQLNQVFMNILTNAIDALDESDQMRSLDQKKQHPSTIRIKTEVVGKDRISISISDNGLGIPKSIQEKVFDPFFTTKTVGKGTGLGMSISYQIIFEKHNGTLECISVPELGTEFVIQIPIRRSDTATIR